MIVTTNKVIIIGAIVDLATGKQAVSSFSKSIKHKQMPKDLNQVPKSSYPNVISNSLNIPLLKTDIQTDMDAIIKDKLTA
jgi:hypothetical protein